MNSTLTRGSMNMSKALFLWYIFFLPLDGTDYLSIYVGSIHVGVVDCLLAMLLFMVSAKAVRSKRGAPLIFQRFLLLFTLAIGVSLVSFFYIPEKTMMYDLKITLNLIEYTALFFIVTMLVNDLEYLKKIVVVYFVSVFILALLTIAKSLGIEMPGYERINNTQIGPFFIGTVALFNGMMSFSLAILATLPALMLNVISRKLWLKSLLFIVLLLAIVISFSRSLWIAVIFELFFIWHFKFYKKMSKGKRYFSWVFLIPALFVAVPYLWESMLWFENLRTSTVIARLDGYFLSLKLSTSNVLYFLFGIGKGSYIQQSLELIDLETAVHNVILDIFVSKGIVMVLIIGTIVGIISKKLYNLLTFYNAWESSTATLALSFGAVFVGLLTKGMFAPITTSIIFWTFLSLGYSLILISSKREVFVIGNTKHRARK